MSTSKSYLLAINPGSSSIKSVLFEIGEKSSKPVWNAAVEDISLQSSKLLIAGKAIAVNTPSHEQAVHELLDRLSVSHKLESIESVGYRVVFGGRKFGQPRLIDDVVVGELEQLGSYDPDHMPYTVAIIKQIRALLPSCKHVACFDSAFYAGLPSVARVLPLPRKYQALGLVRHGYHGLSYSSLLDQLGEEASGKKIVLAHLGSGASITAVNDGVPIDTTMSFSPTSGIPMSSRSGDIDPSIVMFLLEHEKMDAKAVSKLLNKHAGLLGVSDSTSDMYTLLKQAPHDSKSQDAIDMFCYEVKKRIGAFSAAMGGIDILVFSGGIGERSVPIRAQICRGLEFLGLELDPQKNAGGSQDISKDGTIAIRVMHTDEESVIAKQTRELLSKQNQ